MVSSPAIMRSVVDLPQPEGPSSTMDSPSCTVRSTESTARSAVAPNRLQTFCNRTTATDGSLSFDGAGRHALDQLFREEGVDHDHRQHRDHDAGRDHADVLEIVAHETLDADRQRALLLV